MSTRDWEGLPVYVVKRCFIKQSNIFMNPQCPLVALWNTQSCAVRMRWQNKAAAGSLYTEYTLVTAQVATKQSVDKDEWGTMGCPQRKQHLKGKGAFGNWGRSGRSHEKGRLVTSACGSLHERKPQDGQAAPQSQGWCQCQVICSAW